MRGLQNIWLGPGPDQQFSSGPGKTWALHHGHLLLLARNKTTGAMLHEFLWRMQRRRRQSSVRAKWPHGQQNINLLTDKTTINLHLLHANVECWHGRHLSWLSTLGAMKLLFVAHVQALGPLGKEATEELMHKTQNDQVHRYCAQTTCTSKNETPQSVAVVGRSKLVKVTGLAWCLDIGSARDHPTRNIWRLLGGSSSTWSSLKWRVSSPKSKL